MEQETETKTQEQTAEEVKSEQSQKQLVSNLFFVQTVICMTVLIIFLIIRFVSNTFFGGLKLEYDRYFARDIPLSVIQSKVSGYIGNVSSDGNDKNGDKDESQESTDKEDKDGEDKEEKNEDAENDGGKSEKTTEPKISTLSPVSHKTSENKMKSKINECGINKMIVPVDGAISSHYHFRTNPITGNYELHTGLDIAAEQGKDILAAMDGVVTASVYSDAVGNYIIIKHGDRVTTAYGHCSKLIAQKGDKVKKGDVVALVGSTGNSTGPHCHFEIRIDNVAINPEWVLDVSNMNEL